MALPVLDVRVKSTSQTNPPLGQWVVITGLTHTISDHTIEYGIYRNTAGGGTFRIYGSDGTVFGVENASTSTLTYWADSNSPIGRGRLDWHFQGYQTAAVGPPHPSGVFVIAYRTDSGPWNIIGQFNSYKPFNWGWNLSGSTWLHTPEVTNQNPSDGQTIVGVEDTVSFDLLGLGFGIYAPSVIVWVNDVKVYFSEAPIPGWTADRDAITDGYTYTLTGSSFTIGTNSVRVYAKDLLTNPADYTWHFVSSPENQIVPKVYPVETHPGWKWDLTTWPDDENRHDTCIPSLCDALFSGIPSDYWQSGIGGGKDLELTDFIETYTSGIASDFNTHEWIPVVKHGTFFLGPYRNYLYGDDSVYHNLKSTDLLPGCGVNYLEIPDGSKLGIPITARQYKWLDENNRYSVAIDVKQKGFFTGIRDSDLARVDTFNLDKNEIIFSGVDTAAQEFIVYFSGSPRTEYLVFNQQFSTAVGNGTAGEGEVVGYATGRDNEVFNIDYSPIDGSILPVIYTYIAGTPLVNQEWTPVSGLATTLTGYQVGIDYDLGLIKFPGSAGSKPNAGDTVEIHYNKTVQIEYEPSESTELVECLEANANPVQSYENGEFIFLTDRYQEPAYITLSADLDEISTNIFGPLYIGNNQTKLIATVTDQAGTAIEGEEVTFSMTTTLNIGNFGSGGNRTKLALTNATGQAKAYYRSPSTIEDLGEYIVDPGVVDNSPSYPGVTQTKTFRVSSLPMTGGAEDVTLFKVWTDDLTLGYRDPSISIDPAVQLADYYNDYFVENEIYGPTGLYPGTTTSEPLADTWEYTYRYIWNLIVPVIYDGTGGRKVVVFEENVADTLDPHEFNTPAVAPFKPIDVITISSTVFDVVYDTSTYVLDDPDPSGINPAYFLVSPVMVEFQASVYIARIGRTLYSNTITIQLDIPSHMDGTWLIDNLNSVDLEEISPILAAKDPASILNKKVIFGMRLKSDNITLAGALGGITFLDINSRFSPDIWPSLGQIITVSGIS